MGIGIDPVAYLRLDMIDAVAFHRDDLDVRAVAAFDDLPQLLTGQRLDLGNVARVEQPAGIDPAGKQALLQGEVLGGGDRVAVVLDPAGHCPGDGGDEPRAEETLGQMHEAPLGEASVSGIPAA